MKYVRCYSSRNSAQTASTIAIKIHCVPASHNSTAPKETIADKTTATTDSPNATFDAIAFFIFTPPI